MANTLSQLINNLRDNKDTILSSYLTLWNNLVSSFNFNSSHVNISDKLTANPAATDNLAEHIIEDLTGVGEQVENYGNARYDEGYSDAGDIRRQDVKSLEDEINEDPYTNTIYPDPDYDVMGQVDLVLTIPAISDVSSAISSSGYTTSTATEAVESAIDALTLI